MSDPGHDDGEPTHGYYDWQVSTLLLAYDAQDPLSRDDLAGQQQRQESVEREVRDLALRIIPPDYQSDATRELTPEIVVAMTRATLRRAAAIVGLL